MAKFDTLIIVSVDEAKSLVFTMHMITRFSGAIGYVVFATLIVMTTAAYLDKQLVKGDRIKAKNFVDQSEMMLNDVPSSSRYGMYEHSVAKRQFSVTQDLDALSEMLREAARRRRLQNAINFFNALKKRDTESTYGHLLPEQQANNIRK